MAKKPASGMYKTKARNLTDAQLKRAKGASAAGKRTVSVSDTSRATTGENKGYTLGAGGKRLTGTVIMANGDRAVYKGGKRVTNVPKSSLESRGGTSRTTSVSKTVDTTKSRKSAELTIAQRNKLGKGRKDFKSGATRMTTPTKTAPKTFGGSSVSSSSSKTGSSSTGKNWYSQGGGGLFGPNSPFRGNESSSPTKSNLKVGTRVGNKVWNGTRWVTKK